MFKIKKQINTLYLTSVLSNLSITGAWVAILAARGFSLVQIGFAETIFHITSLIFEIPSGLMADVYGRKKMLLLSNLMTAVAGIIMAMTDSFTGVCISFVFHALGYNFASGSGDALAYDSYKLVNMEDRYERYASNQLIIYRITSSISTMCAGLALLMGYRPAYLISAAWSLFTMLVGLRLVEVRLDTAKDEKKTSETKGILKKMFFDVISYFKESLLFLMRNPKAAKLMFANSFVGAIDILLLFFLQSKLRTTGISDLALGIALFIMELGGIAGAKLILKAKKARYVRLFIICTCGVIAGVLLEHTSIAALMTLGGFISSMADDALQIRTDAKLQDSFPSEQRATLISISSFTFSVIMIVLSPLAGFFFEIW